MLQYLLLTQLAAVPINDLICAHLAHLAVLTKTIESNQMLSANEINMLKLMAPNSKEWVQFKQNLPTNLDLQSPSS